VRHHCQISRLTLIHNRMGNSPSISGLGGGRTHVRRDSSTEGSDRGRRPEQSQSETIDTRVLEDLGVEETADGDRLSAPELLVSYSIRDPPLTAILHCDNDCALAPKIINNLFFITSGHITTPYDTLATMRVLWARQRYYFFTYIFSHTVWNFERTVKFTKIRILRPKNLT